MNLLPLVESLTIITKTQEVKRFGDVMNYAQREVIISVEQQLSEGKPVRIIVLKARQIGISTVVEAILFIMAMFQKNTKCMVIAHELDASEHLLGITTNYWNSWELNPLFTPKHASTKRLGWIETNSQIQITTAKNVATGRSRTIHFLHASEVAFWPDPDTLMTGLNQSVPNTPNSIIILESTANGLGDYFSAKWDDAVDGVNEYVPLFFPWYRHPEYRASYTNLPFNPLPPNPDPSDAKEEQALKSLGISDDSLAWRRWAIQNLCDGSIDKFHQEYPTTPEEAFLASGTNIFSLPKLREVYEPMAGARGRLVNETNGRVRFVSDPNGPLKIFKKPSDDRDYGVYMVSGDPTRTTRGDPACCQVINRRTWEQVATWRGKIDPSSFATILAQLGKYYNMGMVVPETNGPGFATIGALLQMDYPYIWNHQWADKAPGKVGENFGWDTTHKRKHWAIGNLQKAVIDRDIIIHDSETFNELKNFVTLPNGEMGPNSPDGHDDTVMALAIALTATITEASTIPAYGTMTAAGSGIVGQVKEMVRPVWEEWDEDVV